MDIQQWPRAHSEQGSTPVTEFPSEFSGHLSKIYLGQQSDCAVVFLWWFCVAWGMVEEINKETVLPQIPEFVFSHQKIFTTYWFFLPLAGPIKGIDVHPHLILKSNFWRFKIKKKKKGFNTPFHFFLTSFCYCLYTSCFPAYDEIASPQPYLPGEMLKCAISWDLTHWYRLASLVLFFRSKVRSKALTTITQQRESYGRKYSQLPYPTAWSMGKQKTITSSSLLQ